jgi:hypothetical protein
MRLEAPDDATTAGRHARAKPFHVCPAVSHGLCIWFDCANTAVDSDTITIADVGANAKLRKAMESSLEAAFEPRRNWISPGERHGQR